VIEWLLSFGRLGVELLEGDLPVSVFCVGVRVFVSRMVFRV